MRVVGPADADRPEPWGQHVGVVARAVSPLPKRVSSARVPDSEVLSEIGIEAVATIANALVPGAAERRVVMGEIVLCGHVLRFPRSRTVE